jgi:hypothetical protein
MVAMAGGTADGATEVGVIAATEAGVITVDIADGVTVAAIAEAIVTANG